MTETLGAIEMAHRRRLYVGDVAPFRARPRGFDHRRHRRGYGAQVRSRPVRLRVRTVWPKYNSCSASEELGDEAIYGYTKIYRK